MTKSQPQKTIQCDYCHTKIEYGKDVITVDRAVIGPRGVIPLDEEYRFCSEECVSKYFDRDPRHILKALPPRIP